MKNWRIAQHSCKLLESGGSSVLQTCVNDEQKLLFAATAALTVHVYEDINTSVQDGKVASVAKVCIPGDSNAVQITTMSYCVDIETLVVGLSDGGLIGLIAPTWRVEEIGACDSRILVLEWSPDGEMLGIVTGAGKLLMMTQEWDMEAEVDLQQWNGIHDAQAEEAPVFEAGSISMSWRGDSQYFCTASQSTEEEAATYRVWAKLGCQLHSSGDSDIIALAPIIAWQPNGRHAFCAQHLGNRKRVAIFELNGLGHGDFTCCEEPDFVISHLSWSSDSELLAIVLCNEVQGGCEWIVQLWQRTNWHWYCKLEQRYADCDHVMLSWSETSASTLHIVTSTGTYHCLALTTAIDVSPLGTVAVMEGKTLLVTPMRHSIVPPPMASARVLFDAAVTSLCWGDIEDCEVLMAMLSNGKLAACVSIEDDLWEETAELASDNLGAIQDHCPCLQGTDLQYVSPDVGVIPSSVRLMFALSPVTLLLVATPDPVMHPHSNAADLLVFVHMCWPTKERGVDETMGAPEIVATSEQMVSQRIVGGTSVGGGRAVLQGEDGVLLEVFLPATSDVLSAEATAIGSFPKACPTVMVPTEEISSGASLASVCIGLSQTGTLYCGEQQVALAVTSACLRQSGPGGSFLLYTTRNNMLNLVPLKDLLARSPGGDLVSTVEGLPNAGNFGGSMTKNTGLGAGKNPNLYTAMHTAMRPTAQQMSTKDGAIRAMEMGARLIVCAPGAVQCVVQMPRGNLETVQPRILVLSSVAQHLCRDEFYQAFSEAAVSRVDLNFIVDYSWPKLLDHCASFIEEAREEDVCDILTSLKPEDCTAPGTLYACAPRPPPPMLTNDDSDLPPVGLRPMAAPTEPQDPFHDKINRVCASVRDACRDSPSRSFRKAVVMSHIRSVPVNLEAALMVIKEAKELEMEPGFEVSTSGHTSAEAVLKFLLLHIDAEMAYQTALGMYELQLAYMVIAASQRDPAEYLLQLQTFAEIPDDHMQRHAIDVQLGRTESALEHAVAAGPGKSDVALAYARKHNLLRNLLSLLHGQPELRFQAMVEYAKWLEERGKLDDAAVAFLACSKTQDALRCYQHSGDWHMAFSLAQSTGLDPPALRHLALSLIDQLAQTGRSESAGHVAMTHLQDSAQAVTHYLDGGHWRLALHAISLGNNPNLLQTVLAPSAARSAVLRLKDIRDDEERTQKYWLRLKALRAKRLAMADAIGDMNDGDGMDPLADGFSDVMSLASNMSAYTDRSTAAGSTITSSGAASTVGGRAAAKKAAKRSGRGKIRQGTPEEEQKLRLLLSELAPSPALLTQVSQLCEVLVQLGHEMDAVKLQAALDGALKLFQEAATDLIANCSPPANGTPKAKQDANSTDASIRYKSYELSRTSWKWDLLRDAPQRIH